MIKKFFKQIFKIKKNAFYNIDGKTYFEIILIAFIGMTLIAGFACMLTDGITWFPTSLIAGSIWSSLWTIACFFNFYQKEKELEKSSKEKLVSFIEFENKK